MDSAAGFEHPFPFDPAGGYSLEQLRDVEPPQDDPGDFDDFWMETRALAMAEKLDWRIEGEPFELADRVVRYVSYRGLLGNRIGGWFSEPATGQNSGRGFVRLHGYGGLQSPAPDIPISRASCIEPCLSGLPDFSRHAGIPDEASRHVLHGIESRETYIHRFCVCDVWRAASVLLEMRPDLSRLDLIGSSFGGGIGALALPWDMRFRAAHLVVPSFGHHPLRADLASVGSGEAVRLHLREHPEALGTLAYFDAARAARRFRVPVHLAVAAFDPAVPPAGQFAIFNAAQQSVPTQLFALRAGHFGWEGEAEEMQRLQDDLTRFFGLDDTGKMDASLA